MKTTEVLTVCAVLGLMVAMACIVESGGARSATAADEPGKFKVEKAPFGKLPGGQEVTEFTITGPKGTILKMIDYGATVTELHMPDKAGKMANVNVRMKDLDGHTKNTAYYGATIGRYGNRIAKGKFTLDGKEYTLATNNGANHLHGGPKGFDKQMWKAKEVSKPDAAGLEFTYVSKDGEEGYPGNLTVKTTYWLTADNALEINYEATTDKPTVANLTNHNYWNLAGAGVGDIQKHEMMIAADKYLEVDDGLIPTGKQADVKGTPLDLTSSKALGPGIAALKPSAAKGYDHCYVLRSQDGKMALAATVKDPASGRVMEVWTDQPGIQLYSGNFLDGTPINGGAIQHAAFCLETQHYPDSPNRPDFPSTVLKPGQTLKSTSVYKFKAN